MGPKTLGSFKDRESLDQFCIGPHLTQSQHLAGVRYEDSEQDDDVDEVVVQYGVVINGTQCEVEDEEHHHSTDAADLLPDTEDESNAQSQHADDDQDIEHLMDIDHRFEQPSECSVGCHHEESFGG